MIEKFSSRNVKKLVLSWPVLLFILITLRIDVRGSRKVRDVLEIDRGGEIIVWPTCFRHRYVVESFYASRKFWKTSNLGTILYKNVDPEVFIHSSRENNVYQVLIWQQWKWLMTRHVYNYKTVNKTQGLPKPNILKDCGVKNCVFSGNNKLLGKADAVVVHIQRGVFPQVDFRNTSQRWILLSDDPPTNMFTEKAPNWASFANIFNWTMSYRSHSDIPVPYGRTIRRLSSIPIVMRRPLMALSALVPYWKLKKNMTKVHTAILISNCNKERMNIIDTFEKYNIHVDIYGKCGEKYKTSCPGHLKKDCAPLKKYLFYLVLESASCSEYLTEKIFYNAFSKGAIPVISGVRLEDCQSHLPPNSYIHMNDYKSHRALAQELKRIVKNPTRILYYHQWRIHFKVVNEHGYFGTQSVHFCRICEALNYNDGEVSIYDEEHLKEMFDVSYNCEV